MVLYNIGIRLAVGLAHVAALFNHKARVFVKSRSNLFRHLTATLPAQKNLTMWMHCASLGEFEQGRPIIEEWRKQFPSYTILLTFFSPSGYNVCKEYKGVDFVFYLPWDITSHIKKFIALVNPKIVIIVKYEFWFNLVNELHKRNIPTILVSALFRKNQFFFKPYGYSFRVILFRYHHFFVQNTASMQLLNAVGISNVTLAGDNRIDRVYQIAQKEKRIPIVERFKSERPIFVVGSCQPEDMLVLVPFINNNCAAMKFIIAPHSIEDTFMASIEKALHTKSIRYSNAENISNDDSILLIDNVGLLSHLYRYGDFAYIGGGFGAGIHNILEAACFGIPVFFGDKNYQKFEEAKALIARGGAFTIHNYKELEVKFNSLHNHSDKYALACEASRGYVLENTGATKKVIAHCRHLIEQQ